MEFCLLVPWKVTAGSCRQMKRLLGMKADSAVLFLWSVRGQSCCVQMQPQQMTQLLHFQWWTAVDLWDHVILVTITFLYMVYWWGNHGISGDKAIEDSSVNFHFCLCISGDHSEGKGINYAEGSVTEGNPLLHRVKPVNLLLLPVGHCLLKAISHSFIAPGDNTAGTGVFFSQMMTHIYDATW